MRSGALQAVQFFAEMFPTDHNTTLNLYTNAAKTGPTDALTQNPALGNLITGNLVNIPRPPAISAAVNPPSPLTLYFDDNSMENLWMAITWGKA